MRELLKYYIITLTNESIIESQTWWPAPGHFREEAPLSGLFESQHFFNHVLLRAQNQPRWQRYS